MTRYHIDFGQDVLRESPDGHLVSYQQAQAEIDERDTKIANMVAAMEEKSRRAEWAAYAAAAMGGYCACDRNMEIAHEAGAAWAAKDADAMMAEADRRFSNDTE